MARHMNPFLSNVDRALRPRGHVFYGWWIVLATGGIHLLSSVLWMQSYGAYVVLLQEEFGWSKTLIAGAFALTRIESGVLGPLQGWMVDRFGPRIVLQVGTVMYGVGFMLFSTVETVFGFYMTFALIAVGSSLGGFATIMVSVVSWFSRHRAKAIALSQLGFSIGGLCVPLVVIALESFGWRGTAMISGVLVLILGLPLAQVVRHRPEPYGEVADGIAPDEAVEAGVPAAKRKPEREFTARQAMRTSAFWLISRARVCTVGGINDDGASHLASDPK